MSFSCGTTFYKNSHISIWCKCISIPPRHLKEDIPEPHGGWLYQTNPVTNIYSCYAQRLHYPTVMIRELVVVQSFYFGTLIDDNPYKWCLFLDFIVPCSMQRPTLRSLCFMCFESVNMCSNLNVNFLLVPPYKLLPCTNTS